MSRHNYTNPAFCQGSEFYPYSSVQKQGQSMYNRSLNFSISTNGVEQVKSARDGPLRTQRSMSTRSFCTLSRKSNIVERQGSYRGEKSTPPIPGPKPVVNLNCTTGTFDTRSGSGRYALVPVEELPTARKDRYAIVPGPVKSEVVTPRRFVKSQDNLDRYSHLPTKESALLHNDSGEQFTSLPPIPMFEEQPRMKPAFSSDFGSKSFVLVDQKNNQRYAMVPTAEDEEIVDDNHEIIQMHNGRTHRYAVIPTDEEETCLSISDLSQGQNNQDLLSRTPLQTSTPQKGSTVSSYPNTPLKNPAATRKLHELLSTPRKTPIKRSMSTLSHSNQNTPRYYQSQQIYPSQMERKNELAPHQLQYESPKEVQRHLQTDARTTAVIMPRVATSSTNTVDDSLNKSWNRSYPQKVANAAATLAVISLMMILSSAMNAGLCIYMIAHMGKSFYLQFSLAAAFFGVGLGYLGFRSRHSEWLPNRSYTSGYILVTIFCLLKCCGLLVLLVLDPYPGLPLHDVTTGVIFGLSGFIILFIGLGVIGSYWCYRPPPDNRVNVVY